MNEPHVVTSDQQTTSRRGLANLRSTLLLIGGIIVVLICVGLALWAGGKDNNPTAPSGIKPATVARTVANVSITSEGKLEPAEITVKAGATVTWNNHDSDDHQLVARDAAGKSLENFGLGEPLAPNDTYSFIFEHPGTYHYYDSQSRDLNGTIIVQ